MRNTLRNKLIATIGERPIWIREIVQRCGSRKLDRPSRIHAVLWELKRLEALGLVTRISGSRWMCGDGCQKREKR